MPSSRLDACRYYQLKPQMPEFFKSTSDVAKAVATAASLLRLARSALGITCSAKGAFAGRLRIQQDDGSWADCSTSSLSGFPIPGCPADILEARFDTDARS